MTAAQVIGLVDFHHGIRHAEGGTDDHWNLEPLLRADHKARTASTDVPSIAKNKRIREKWLKHQETMASKTGPRN